jgi:hypothetical protein
MKRTLGLVLATVALGVLASSASAAPRGTLYQFRGHLKAASAGAVSITVEGGNRIALKKMLGAPVDQTFAAGSSTEFLRWSKGIPSVVGPGDLAAGDWVAVKVRAPRDASLSEIEAKAVGIVADHGPNPNPPDQPLYLFRGKLVSAGSGSLTVTVGGGNRRGLRLLVGQTTTQTFATGGETIYLLWQGKVPTVISAAQLQAGDRVTVRIRAKAGSSLGEVEATAANHVGEHEPAAA